MIDIQLRGIEEAMTQLGVAESIDMLRPPMERSMLLLVADMAKYPAQRSGSRYRRTGTLGRRWTKSVRADYGGLTGTVGNNTSYGPYVQSAERQAWMHQGIWQTDQSVAHRRQSEIVADFERAIQRALGR